VTAVKALVHAAVVGGVLAAHPAVAQPLPTSPRQTPEQIHARHAISALEGVLEAAVRYGAQMLDQRLQASSAANMVMLAGIARARGFRLDDYGVVFDVEFPSLRRSMVWSLQTLERDGARSVSAAAPSVQPREIYLTEITNALIDAVVDHGPPIGVAPQEWLTVAARESVDRRFVPGDPNDAAMTVVLRIKGSDLNALRDRTLAREDARKRVDVKVH
jgi:hypothetical protein